MSMDIVSRLRCVLKGDKTAQAGADEIERLRAELAASRERFDKAAAAFEREQDRALAAEVRAETAEAALAASGEREARMRDAVAWLERRLFDRKWGGTLGATCDWYMAIGYRHALQNMKGASLLEAVEFAALAEGAQG